MLDSIIDHFFIDHPSVSKRQIKISAREIAARPAKAKSWVIKDEYVHLIAQATAARTKAAEAAAEAGAGAAPAAADGAESSATTADDPALDVSMGGEAEAGEGGGADADPTAPEHGGDAAGAANTAGGLAGSKRKAEGDAEAVEADETGKGAAE